MVGTSSLLRLALAKLLFMNAAENGNIVERVVSVHNLDLSVEISLKTAASELSVVLPANVKFPDLWNRVDAAYFTRFGKKLPLRIDITTIHDKRNSVQHHGSIPSDTDLRQFKTDAFQFLNEVFQTLTGRTFHQVFLSSLIDNIELRQMMETSEANVSNNPKLSMESSMKSFAWAKLLTQRRLGYFDPTLGAFNPQNPMEMAIKEPVTGVVKPILDHLLTLELGIDAVRYNRINLVAPITLVSAGVTKLGDVTVGNTLASNYTESNAWFCYDFVLENILNWQDRGVF
jgi:hypothetical protein